MSAPTPKEIRDCFQDYRTSWQTTRDEAAADMKCLSVEGPWTPEDRAAREDAGRPCIHLDKCNQYVNQYAGNLRKNKRAIKATPKGDGANDADAKNRSNLIMGIEERSNAVSSVYIPTGERTAMSSYAFAVLRTEYKDDSSFDQEIIVKPVPNPDTVLIDPNYKQPDASDIKDGFLLDLITRKEFKSRYKDEAATDFTDEQMSGKGVTDWVKEKYVQIAEYWKVEYDRSKLLLVETEKGPVIFTEEEWKEAKQIVKGQVKRERTIEKPRVMQYMTNGVEILDEIPWAGSRIPIISCLGPERWTTEGGNSKRTLLSLVRFARDPQMLYDFLASQEAEEAGMVPKVPFIGAKGQFESDKEVWEELNKVPHAFVQYDAMTDATGQNALPPPSRPQYTANFQEYELAKDSANRDVQAAMGISPMPDAAQRRGQKSGVALEKMDSMEALGSFHFVDRYENGFLHNMGWQINELITPILDTPRQMPFPQPDGTRSLMHLVGNTSHPIGEDGVYEVQGFPTDPKTGGPVEHVHTGKGEFDVTISAGPAEDSERQEQNEFVDQLLENIQTLPQPGTPQAKVLALGIKMRPTLGPVGKQIADIFDPPPTGDMPPQAQAAISTLQSQLQGLQQENAALHADRAGRVLEQQTKVHLEQLKGQNAVLLKRIDQITQVIKAQLAAKSRSTDQQAQVDAQKELALLDFDHQQIDRAHDAAHDVALAGVSHANAKELADRNAAAQVEQPQTGV